MHILKNFVHEGKLASLVSKRKVKSVGALPLLKHLCYLFSMAQIFHITQPKRFSLEEANQLLPVIRKITKETLEAFLILEAKLQHYEAESEKYKEIEKSVNELLNKWAEKINKLGAEPKGIWLVDFNSGEGYYCWRYDEEKVEYFHSYEEGFSGRKPIH